MNGNCQNFFSTLGISSNDFLDAMNAANFVDVNGNNSLFTSYFPGNNDALTLVNTLNLNANLATVQQVVNAMNASGITVDAFVLRNTSVVFTVSPITTDMIAHESLHVAGLSDQYIQTTLFEYYDSSDTSGINAAFTSACL